jgi:hypothetical protein
MTGFILATALWSPAMLGGQDWGGLTTVLAWVLTGAVFAYAKVSFLFMTSVADPDPDP